MNTNQAEPQPKQLTGKDRGLIAALAEQGTYRNSQVVNLGGVPYSMREVLIAAPLIAGLNVYLVGGTGEGKTQLANDLAGFFGSQYCYAEGRPDFELAELLKQVNLGRLHEAKTDRELIELTENVQKALFYVDEINRCPPIVQNYFFNFFDGKLVHGGKILRLGKDGYAVGYASGNIGDGAYVGIQDSDRALKDRMHLIVKLDYPDYATTEEDDQEIFGGSKSPRAKLLEGKEDYTSQIIDIHRRFGEREVPLVLRVLGAYFHKGLDWLENTSKHSKRAVDQGWPNVSGIRTDTDENKVMPLSKRAVLATMSLTESLRWIAEAKMVQAPDAVELYLDALRLTIPYSGVLSSQYVQMECGGDPYVGFDNLMAGWRSEITGKKSDLETALAYALYGEREESLLDKICPPGVQGRWAPVRRSIEYLASKPTLDTQKINTLREEYKKA
ncbi:AAA family ATPase [Candidatus Woesearchaeota archaeon]|nr:AAA family ATPase [Candidatus Woesearchaeota archaeon]